MDNEALPPSVQPNTASGSPLGFQAPSVQPLTNTYIPDTPILTNPVPKNSRIAYIVTPIILYVLPTLANIILIQFSGEDRYRGAGVLGFGAYGLYALLVLVSIPFILYVFFKQLKVIKTVKPNTYSTYLVPPIICGSLVLVGAVIGCIWAILDFGDRIADGVTMFLIGGVMYGIGTVLYLIYFFGIAEMIYIAQQGLKKGWNTFGRVLTVLLYVGFGLLSFGIAGLVHTLLDPSTE